MTHDLTHLSTVLGSDRFNTYLKAAADDLDAAFALYQWNIAAAAAWCVCPLVGQMPPNASTELLVCLPDVDRFSVVVVEGVASPLRVSPPTALWIFLIESRIQHAAKVTHRLCGQ